MENKEAQVVLEIKISPRLKNVMEAIYVMMIVIYFVATWLKCKFVLALTNAKNKIQKIIAFLNVCT